MHRHSCRSSSSRHAHQRYRLRFPSAAASFAVHSVFNSLALADWQAFHLRVWIWGVCA